MDDALLVSGAERIANLSRVLQYLIERQRPLERSALDELHHKVVRPDVINLADICVIQGGDGPCLACNAFGELLVDCLDSDNAIESGIARLVHLAHAAGADELSDFIRSQPGSGGQWHA